MQFLDSHGWPVEIIKGRPITNFIRRILHTRKIKLGTWQQTLERSNDSNCYCEYSSESPDKSCDECEGFKDCGCRNFDPIFGCSNCDRAES